MEKPIRRPTISWVSIVVISAVLILLAAFLLPMFVPQTNERNRQTACLSNQREIANALIMYAQENNETLPGALRWDSGEITSSHKQWLSDVSPSLSKNALHCRNSKAKMSYGMAADLGGGQLGMIPTGNQVDTLLTADANIIEGSDDVAGLLFSLDDINTTIHDRAPHIGFVASFLDGHVACIHSWGSILSDAVDATTDPAFQIGSDILYQGADHLFIIDGAQGKVSGDNFINNDVGRTHYFAFYYASVPAKGQGITINAPGGPVTLIAPTKGKYYTIFVNPRDRQHKFTASLNGTTLTISNDN